MKLFSVINNNLHCKVKLMTKYDRKLCIHMLLIQVYYQVIVFVFYIADDIVLLVFLAAEMKIKINICFYNS